jgi:hypothetical protein
VREIRRPRIAFAATTVLALAFALNVRSAYWLLAESHAHGLGLASVSVKTSPILSAVRGLPSGYVVATNGPDLFALYLPQKSIQFPYRYDPHADREAVDAEARMQELASRVDALCFFTEFEYRKYQPGRAQVAELARGAFKAFYEGDDGAVWVRESLGSAPGR